MTPLFVAAQNFFKKFSETALGNEIPYNLRESLHQAEIMAYNAGMDGGTPEATYNWAESVVQESFSSDETKLQRKIKTTEISIQACEAICQMPEEELCKREAAKLVPEKNHQELEIEQETKEAELKKANKKKEKKEIKKRTHALLTELGGDVGGKLTKGFVRGLLFILSIVIIVEGLINYTAFLGLGLPDPLTMALGVGTAVFIGFICSMVGVFMRIKKKLLAGGVSLLGLLTTALILLFRHNAEVDLSNILLLDAMNIIFYIVGTIMSMYINFYTYKTKQYWAEVDRDKAVDTEISSSQTVIDLKTTRLEGCNRAMNAKVFEQADKVRGNAINDLEVLNSRLADLNSAQEALTKRISTIQKIFRAKITTAFEQGQTEAN